MKKIYLATNYSSNDSKVLEERFNAVNKFASKLMQQGNIVFSPISHSHPISLEMDNNLDLDFWLNQDNAFLDWCDEMYVFKQEGWEESKGVKYEIEYINKLNKPISYHG